MRTAFGAAVPPSAPDTCRSPSMNRIAQGAPRLHDPSKGLRSSRLLGLHPRAASTVLQDAFEAANPRAGARRARSEVRGTLLSMGPCTQGAGTGLPRRE